MPERRLYCKACGKLLAKIRGDPSYHYAVGCPIHDPTMKIVYWEPTMIFLNDSYARCDVCDQEYHVEYDSFNFPVLRKVKSI